MKHEGAAAYCYENAELRQRIAELEKENTKLKRRLDGERKRNDPVEKFARLCARADRRRSKYTDPDSLAG